MKKSNILLATSTVALLATGCVKPAQDNQAIYNDATQPVYNTGTQQADIYQPSTVYQPSAGVVYEEAVPDTTVITTGTAVQQPIGGVTTYPDTYGSNVGTTTTYPDPYANGAGTTTPVTTYPDPYAGQPVTDYPATTSTSVGQVGGVQLQIAALKDYSTAEDYKNRLSLAPGLSAYVQRGAMNKVIVTGIKSVSEANRLKESRFPGAFIVHGGSSSSYTPVAQPNYGSTSSGGYSVNNPYGTPSSSPYSTSSNNGVGVQIGAFGSRGKAQSVADAQSARYPATVKKIGRLYKVILTGFSSRSAAKSYAGRVGGFVVSTY